MKVEMDVERHLNDGTYAYYTTKLRLASLGQRLVYIQRQLLAFNLLKELQVRRGVSKPEMEMYFVYLDLYLNPAVQQRNRSAFYSSFKLTRLIAARCAEIETLTGKKLLGRQQKHLFSTMSALIEKRKLICLQDPKTEREANPDLFSKIREPRRGSHKKTFQPTIVRIAGGATPHSPKIRAYLDSESSPATPADKDHSGMSLFYTGSMGEAIELRPEDVHDFLQQIILGEFCTPSGEKQFLRGDSALSKKLDWFYRSIFDDAVLVKNLQFQCLKYLNGIFLDDEELGDLFLLAADEYHIDEYANTYSRLQKIKLSAHPKPEQTKFSPAEMIRLREADEQIWFEAASGKKISGKVPSRKDTALHNAQQKRVAERSLAKQKAALGKKNKEEDL